MSMHGRTTRPDAGFTLIELLVAILISVALIVGMLNLFDLSNRISIEQTEIAEMQQSHRVAQYDVVRLARETARGMVPVDMPDNATPLRLPDGLAVAVDNNVVPGRNLIAGDTSTPLLVDGSDVLTLRGIFSNPIYLVDYGNTGAVTINGDPATDGAIQIDGIYQGTIQQDLQKLLALNPGGAGAQPEALFVVGPRSDASISIVELTGVTGDTNQVTISFDIIGCPRCATYQDLAPWPGSGMRNVAYVGVLEEYQYFVEQQFRDPDDTNSPPMPRMARARFYPGTATAHPSNPGMNTAIADNVFDLQVALGFDSGYLDDGQVDEADPPDDEDDWLFNSDADNPADIEKWVRQDLGGGEFERRPLYYLRINTLIHTDRKFRLHFSDQLEGTPVEDRTDYAMIDSTEELRYRRRWLQSTVDFRNLF